MLISTHKLIRSFSRWIPNELWSCCLFQFISGTEFVWYWIQCIGVPRFSIHSFVFEFNWIWNERSSNRASDRSLSWFFLYMNLILLRNLKIRTQFIAFHWNPYRRFERFHRKLNRNWILITCVLWELWVDKIRRKSPFNFRLFSFLNGNFSTATHVQHSLNSDGNIECSKNIYTNAADGLQHIGSLTNCAILEHCIIYSQFAWIFLTM